MTEPDPIDASALAEHYSRFRVSERLLLTGHSHQAWPDVAFEAQQRVWLDAALGLLVNEFDTLDLDPAVVDRDRSVPLECLGGFLALMSREAPRIKDALAERGVHVDHRGNVLRVGPAPYLTDEQLRQAVSALGEAVS